MVYDITDRQSYENLSKIWFEDLKEKAPENVTIAILGNKADLLDQEQVSDQDG